MDERAERAALFQLLTEALEKADALDLPMVGIYIDEARGLLAPVTESSVH